MTVESGFGLYVHWPFCQSKCPYCDFNSHVARTINQEEWRSAYRSEIARCRDEFPGRYLNTIYFGGGTPSLMSAETVDAVISAARAAWPCANDLEITLEANPSSVEAEAFSEFADCGVNRISVGVQSLVQEDLARLGRLHNVDEALAALETANDVFSRVSFDLIYARQDQTLAAWQRELAEALTYTTGHISLYQLTIEPGTAFGERFAAGGMRGLPEDELAADMYTLTQEMTAAAGLPSYEVSNHAAPGAESKHNLIYWRGGNWLGIGPGAHGRYTKDGSRVGTETHLSPPVWLQAVKNGSGECSRTLIDPKTDREERLMMGLRLSEGLSRSSFSDLDNKFIELSEVGILDLSDDSVRTTARGRLVLNAIIRELLA